MMSRWLLFTISLGVLQGDCAIFDLGNGEGHIPNKWIEKLDELNLQEQMSSKISMAKREYERVQSQEEYILSSGIHVTKDSSSCALSWDSAPSGKSNELDNLGHKFKELANRFVHDSCTSKGIPHKYCAQYLSRLRLPANSSLAQQCSEINTRSDGQAQAYRRLLPANYEFGVHSIRRAKHGHHLPSPRNVSRQLYEAAAESSNEVTMADQHSAEGKLDRSRSVFFAQWTQFLEQDLVQTVQHRHDNGALVECCQNFFVAAPRRSSFSCSPIKVSESDPYYHQFGVQCMNYVRSAITVDPTCKLGPINQLNMASDHLDLSQVYGTTAETSHRLRLHNDGKLKIESHHWLTSTETTTGNNSNNHDHHQQCLGRDSPSCVQSGDSRVNYSPYMILQHSIFQKSHNRIADQLKTNNPQWSDTKLLETARRINQAIFQKITYEEWLPMVVGHNEALRIRSNNNADQVTGVRGVSNEFATAAIRFYESMLPGDLFEMTKTSQQQPHTKKLFELRDTFYQPQTLNWTQEFRTKIVESTLVQKAMALDTSFVDDLNVDLFRAENSNGNSYLPETKVFGMDSLALDIMRSRDHGLTGYVHYLSACRNARGHEMSSITTWEQLEPQFRAQDFELLRKIYRHVQDIDLIVGAIAELPERESSLVGPTFSCIIAEQMDKSRRSDPHFYSSDYRLKETVQMYSAAKLLCDTMGLMSVQADVFQIPAVHGRNPIVDCAELSNGLRLELWQNVD